MYFYLTSLNQPFPYTKAQPYDKIVESSDASKFTPFSHITYLEDNFFNFTSSEVNWEYVGLNGHSITYTSFTYH